MSWPIDKINFGDVDIWQIWELHFTPPLFRSDIGNDAAGHWSQWCQQSSCQWEFEFLAPQQDRQRHVEETVQGSKKGHPNHPEERPKNNAKIVWFSKNKRKTKNSGFSDWKFISWMSAKYRVNHGQKHGHKALEDATHDDDLLPDQFNKIPQRLIPSCIVYCHKYKQSWPLHDASVRQDSPKWCDCRSRHTLASFWGSTKFQRFNWKKNLIAILLPE